MKKIISKMFMLVAVLFVAVAFAACGGEKISDEQKVDEAIKSILVEDTSILLDDFEVPNKTVKHSLEITWEVLPMEGYASENGKPVGAQVGEKGEKTTTIIIEQDPYEKDKENKWRGAILKATVASGAASMSREWELYIKPEPMLYSIQDCYQLADNDTARIQGEVVFIWDDAYGNNNFYVQDEAGDFIYIYTRAPETLKVGNIVSITGTYTIYYNQPELKECAIEVLEEGDGYDLEAYAANHPMSATEINALDSTVLPNHNFPVVTEGYVIEKPVAIGGSDTDGSSPYGIKDINGEYFTIYNPNDAQKEALASLVGKYVKATVFVNSKHSTYKFWRNILVGTPVETELPVISDAQKIESVKGELAALQGLQVVENIKLPTAGTLFTDATITWASSHPENLDATGKLVAALEDAEIEVTLTATIKAGETTDTYEVKVRVLPSFRKITVKEALALADASLGGEAAKIWIEGKVVVLDDYGNAFVADETGVIYVRTTAEGIVAGDSVKVVGDVSVYQGSKVNQYTRQVNNATYTKLETEVKEITPVFAEIKDFMTVITNNEGKLEEAGNKEIVDFALNGQIVRVKGFVSLRGSYNNAYIGVDATDESDGIVQYWFKSDVEDALVQYEGKEVTIVAPLYDYATQYGWRLGPAISVEVAGEETFDGQTIAEVIAGAAGEYKAKGLVVAMNAQSFVLQDETGLILVYNGTQWDTEINVGDLVTVSGTTSVYGNAVQFGKGSTYEITGKADVTNPEAKELTTAELDAYASLNPITIQYGKITGTLSVSSGKYYNVNVEGATTIGSITYPIDVDATKALDGKKIVVEGYITGFTGGKYVNFVATSVTVVE